MDQFVVGANMAKDDDMRPLREWVGALRLIRIVERETEADLRRQTNVGVSKCLFLLQVANGKRQFNSVAQVVIVNTVRCSLFSVIYGRQNLSHWSPWQGQHRTVKQTFMKSSAASEAYISVEGRIHMIMDTIARTPQAMGSQKHLIPHTHTQTCF